MPKARVNARAKRGLWLIQGLASGLVGIVFSIFLSGLIALLIWAGIDWVELLERRGTDLTMRTAVAFHSPLVERLSSEGGIHIDPIVFIDIDEEGCERLALRPERCGTHGVGQPSVLIPIGEALTRSGARAIVLDVRWPDREAFDERFPLNRMIRAWAGTNGPPVVAALPSALSSSFGVAVDWSVIDAMPIGRLRFAPSALWPGEADLDMIIRSFPDEIPVVGETDPRRPERFATIPLATMEAIGHPVEPAQDPLEGRRILFTLPSLSASGEDARASAFLGHWERRALSGMVAPGATNCLGCPLSIRTEGLADQIVIVGSSSPAANDLHMTPLGVMAGGEIIANAIRTWQLVPSIVPPDPSDLFRAKVLATAPGMVIVLVASLATAWVSRRRRSKFWGRIGQTALVAAIFLGAMAASLAVNLQLALNGLLDAERSGLRTDILLPTLALFLEGFVTFAKWLIDSLEVLIASLLHRIHTRFRSRDARQTVVSGKADAPKVGVVAGDRDDSRFAGDVASERRGIASRGPDRAD